MLMKKHLYALFFLFSLGAIRAYALPLAKDSLTTVTKTVEAESDSLDAVNLDELIVQGRTQRVIKNGVEYLPDKKTRRNSSDATSLLLRMQIPQLNVDPFNGEVKTSAGQDVSFFIDYHKANGEELKGLRPEDVMRVEVLDYPEDPRFEGAAHVVNYVMYRYEWGGYTKLSYDGHYLVDNDFDGSVFSKFVYKRMMFDAYANYDYNFFGRCPSSSTEIYRDVNFAGRHYDEIRRVAEGGFDYSNRFNSQAASFRAIYQTDNVYMQHYVAFNRSANPKYTNLSRVSFSIPGLTDTETLDKGDEQSLSPSVSGYYQFNLPKGNLLSASWSFLYGAKKRHSSYTLAGFDPIINNNREKTYSPYLQLFYSKRLPRNNMFRTSLFSYGNFYKTDYAGSYNDRQNIIGNESMLFLEYIKSWQCGLYLYSRIGASYVYGRINGSTIRSEWNPRLGFQLQYRINEKNSAQVDGWWGNSHVDPSTSNTAIVQSGELMWHQGNPDLKNTLFASANASYTYIPTNKFSLTASFSYEANPHKQALEFYTLAGHDGLVRRSVNSGSGNEYTLRLSGNLRLLDNSLSFNFSAMASRVVLTGIDAQSLNNVSGRLNAQYMRDSWSVALYYQSPSKSLGSWSNGYVMKFKDNYGLEASYNVGDFKAILAFKNWFRKNYFYDIRFDSPLYSSFESKWASNLSRIVNVTLVYTFSYGKKVNRDNEIEGGSSASSAILK